MEKFPLEHFSYMIATVRDFQPYTIGLYWPRKCAQNY